MFETYYAAALHFNVLNQANLKDVLPSNFNKKMSHKFGLIVFALLFSALLGFGKSDHFRGLQQRCTLHNTGTRAQCGTLKLKRGTRSVW